MQNNHNKYAVLVVICPFQLHAPDLDPGPADAEGDQARWPVHLPVHCARHLRHLLWGAFEGRAIYEDPSWTCDHCPGTGHERGKEDEEMVAKQSRSGCMDDLSIALPIFEGAEEQDVVGPYEMFFWMSLFEALPPDRRPIGETDFAVDFIRESEFADYFYPKVAPKAKVFTVAPTINTYVMSSGMQWTPDFSYDNAPPANMIVAPGGRGAHDIPARHKDGTIDYIKRVANAPGSKYVMSVCTGAFLLGAAGLLDGRHCQVSSHNYDRFEREVPKAKLVKDPSLSFVQDGNLFTSNGPCSGHATALRLVEVHCGTGYKNNLRELIEYIVPPVKGALVENGKVTTIVV